MGAFDRMKAAAGIATTASAVSSVSTMDGGGAFARMVQEAAKQTALATERADEADKMLVPSAYRQHQQALATERADEQDKLLVPSESRQAAQAQEGRHRPIAIDMPHDTMTQEEWDARQKDALTQKINDAQTRLDAANARYASVARYGTTADRIAQRTEIKDLEQQIKGLKEERGDPNLLERLGKTLSGTVEQYFGGITNAAGVAAEAQKGTAMSGVYQAQVKSIDQQIAALEKTLNDPTMTEQDIADTNEALRIAREQRALYGSAVRAGDGTAREVYHLADELSAGGAKDLERAKEGASTVGKVGIDVLSQGMQMGTDAALGAITGGGALAPMALRSFGSGAQEARQDGADLQQAVNYGAASAAVEVLTETIVDFAGVYLRKGTADDMIKKVINKLTTDETLRGTLEIAASAAGESVEELVSGIVNPALKSLYNGKSIGENYSELEWKDVLYDALIGGILGGVGGAVDVARGGSDAKSKPRMSMEDFVNTESPVWNNVEYKDIDTQQRLMQEKHQEMVAAGEVVTVPESATDEVAQSYPDLRHMKKSERNPILKQKIRELKDNLREMLNGLKGAYEFEVNGYILEARLYDTGIKEVLEKITQEKAEMLTQSGEIFRKAQYLYSTPDYKKNTDIYRWNYFYTPVQIGDQTVGVRIAVRDVAKGTNLQPESQIYNWGIKENASLGGGQPGQMTSSLNASSDASSAGALGGGSRGPKVASSGASSATTGDNIPQPPNAVKFGESAPASYADTLREMQHPGARQPKSYADDLAHVNELLQNAALSPRDQAYIQEDIADAQRGCDAAVKAIVNPGATAEERAQAVRRAIDALDYARQRIDDLGLPATQLEVGMAQDVLVDISEKLRRYLSQEERGYELEIGLQDDLASSYEDVYNAGSASSSVDESAWRSGSSSTQMPNYSDAVTPREKFANYSLDYENKNAVGKPEAYERALGYTKENADDLIDQIHKAVTSGKMLPYDIEVTEYGTKYKFRIPILGPNGKTKDVIAVYQIDVGAIKPRLVTNYVEAK